MSYISPELVERMVALVRDLHADHLRYDLHDRQQDFCKRTAAIVAELPLPVDPDLIDARRLAAEDSLQVSEYVACGKRYGPEEANNSILAGALDGSIAVQGRLKAIKLGRELARASQC